VSLPIRLRLTAWYVSLLALTVVGLGAFVVLRLQSDLGAQIDAEVRANEVHLARAFEKEGPSDFLDVSRTVLPAATAVAQAIDSRGRPVVSYGSLASARHPLVPPAVRLAALAPGSPRLRVLTVGPERERYRGMVASMRRSGRRYVLVVGESLEPVEDSGQRVLVLLLLAGPAALALIAAGGWWLAGKALRPVKRMTAQADAIGIDELHARIAVPRARDEIADLAHTLNAMLDRLQRGVEDKRRLVADASHELRTPLAVMRAELDVSLRLDDLTPSARAVLESARDEVDAMSRTVDNLVTFAEVDEGRLALLTSHVRLRDAIEAAASRLRPLATANGLRLETAGEPCEGHADPQRLIQALTNIIENAIKSAPPGGQVSVRSLDRSHELVVTVGDAGAIADPDTPGADRRGDSDHALETSDRGLVFARVSAAAHGGRLSVRSDGTSGRRFWLTLPRRAGR
jgi:two-component system OmpR family sensor kinase